MIMRKINHDYADIQMTRVQVTTYLIAERAGVSQATVSKVLNNGGRNVRVSEGTAQRVRQIAESLGYRPNAAARAMSRGKFNAIGLLLSPNYGRSRVFELLFHYLRLELTERGQHLVMGDLPDDKLTDFTVMPKIFREWSVDALLVNYTHQLPPGMLELVRALPSPSVWLNTKLDRNCVYPDDYRAGREMTSRMIELGHRRVGYWNLVPAGATAHYSATDRYRGYRDVMNEAGLPLMDLRPDHELPGPEQLPFATAMLTRGERPTAIVADGFYPLTAVILSAMQVGLRLGRDLSAVCVHQEPAVLGGLAISSMELDHKQMARHAVGCLVEAVDHAAHSQPAIAVPYLFRPGATMGPLA